MSGLGRAAAVGRPNGLQVVFEALLGWVQGQVEKFMGLRAPRGVIALGITLFA